MLKKKLNVGPINHIRSDICLWFIFCFPVDYFSGLLKQYFYMKMQKNVESVMHCFSSMKTHVVGCKEQSLMHLGKQLSITVSCR